MLTSSTGGQHVVHAAVADVVGPAVAAEDPDGLLGQQISIRDDGIGQLAGVAIAGLARGEPLLLIGSAGQVHAVLAGGQQLLAGLLGALGVVHLLEPLGAGFLDGGLAPLDVDQRADVVGELGAALVDGQVHAEAELGVVLEQGVGPGGAMALRVGGVGAGGRGAAVDGRAAGRVGDQHAVAEQLRDELDVRGLAAAGAGAGELEQGLQELAVLDGVGVDARS